MPFVRLQIDVFNAIAQGKVHNVVDLLELFMKAPEGKEAIVVEFSIGQDKTYKRYTTQEIAVIPDALQLEQLLAAFAIVIETLQRDGVIMMANIVRKHGGGLITRDRAFSTPLAESLLRKLACKEILVLPFVQEYQQNGFLSLTAYQAAQAQRTTRRVAYLSMVVAVAVAVSTAAWNSHTSSATREVILKNPPQLLRVTIVSDRTTRLDSAKQHIDSVRPRLHKRSTRRQ